MCSFSYLLKSCPLFCNYCVCKESLGSKITADGDWSHEIKRRLLLGRKVMTNLDSILKSRDITLPKKVSLVKAMVFPVVMYGCESWTVKKAENQRIDAFALWCWRRLLRVHWTARRSNQSILKEIGPGISLEGMMLKLKLQYFGHLVWRVDSLERTLMLGGIGAGGEGDDRGWDGWMASLTRWMWVWVNSGSWWWTERPGMLRFMGSQRVGHDWATDLNWTSSLYSSPLLFSSISLPHTSPHPIPQKENLTSWLGHIDLTFAEALYERNRILWYEWISSVRVRLYSKQGQD